MSIPLVSLVVMILIARCEIRTLPPGRSASISTLAPGRSASIRNFPPGRGASISTLGATRRSKVALMPRKIDEDKRILKVESSAYASQ